MDFKNLLNRFFNNSKEKNIPPPVLKTFQSQFKNSLNIDWSTNGESYEAIFYLNELEHIARIKNDGLLESLKINLPLNKLPLAIHKQVDQLGEVMSAIAIYRENMINYELIVRDHQLNRYFLLLDENGKVIEKEKL